MKVIPILLVFICSGLIGCSSNTKFVLDSKFSYRPNAIGETYYVDQRAYQVDPTDGSLKGVVGGGGHLPSWTKASPLMLWGTIPRKSYTLTTEFTQGKEKTHATTEMKEKNFFGITTARVISEYELPEVSQ